MEIPITYCPVSGRFTLDGKPLKIKTWSNRQSVIAFKWKGQRIYVCAGRLAWTLSQRRPIPPNHYVIHLNGNKADVRLENLACVPATHVRYMQKTPVTSNGGIKNVNWRVKDRVWMVRFKVGVKFRSFGSFKDLEKAKARAEEVRATLLSNLQPNP
jgi:hypothetical protein